MILRPANSETELASRLAAGVLKSPDCSETACSEEPRIILYGIPGAPVLTHLLAVRLWISTSLVMALTSAFGTPLAAANLG